MREGILAATQLCDLKTLKGNYSAAWNRPEQGVLVPAISRPSNLQRSSQSDARVSHLVDHLPRTLLKTEN